MNDTDTAIILLSEHVEAGAEWLDKIQPGWAELIDVNRLNMEYGFYDDSSPCGCVCSQLSYKVDTTYETGDWYSFIQDRAGAQAMRGIFYRFAERHGFYIEDTRIENQYLWDKLTELWRAQIAQRTKD